MAMLRDGWPQKGDRVTIHMPMIPELPISCWLARCLGVVHLWVLAFSGEPAPRAADPAAGL